MKSNQLFLSWYNHNNECWVPYQHILFSIKVQKMQSRSGQHYSLDEDDYTKITFPSKKCRMNHINNVHCPKKLCQEL